MIPSLLSMIEQVKNEITQKYQELFKRDIYHNLKFYTKEKSTPSSSVKECKALISKVYHAKNSVESLISTKYTEYLHRRNGQIHRRGYIPASKGSRHIPDHIKEAVFRRDNGKCVKCGGSVALQYDHIIPFARGGKTKVENIQLLCANCNSLKSDKSDE